MKHSHRTRALRTLGFVGALALGLTACSSSDGGGGATGSAPADGDLAAVFGSEEVAEQMQALYDEALDDGQSVVTVYGTPDHDAFIQAFEDRFPGITITVEQMQGADRDTRLDAEDVSGNHVGDIAKDGSSPIAQYVSDERCQAWDPIVDVPEEWLRLNSRLATSHIGMFGIAYNTEMVEESELPTSWDELLDPKWKGKVSMTSPAAGGVTAYTFAIMLTEENEDTFGWDYIDAFKAQSPNLVAQDALAVQAVATGETPISALVYQPYFDSVKDQGAPIGFSLFTEDNMYSESAFCLLENSPNQKAAELFMNWRFTPEGQEASAATGAYPVMPGAPAPEGMPAFDEISLIPMLPDAERNATYGPLIKEVTDAFTA